MTQAEELLNSISEESVSTFTVDPATEPHIVVGADRFITVPEELRRIAVQYDHDVETVTFDCPRYWDGLDMSQMRVYINYRRPDKYKDAYLAQNITVDETDPSIMHFDWTISRNATEKDGILTFLVCIKKTDEEDNEVNHWNSELNSEMYISPGLECSDESMLLTYPDYLASLETEFQNSFDVLKEDLLNAKASGEFDGVSPTVTVIDIEGGHRVTITDANGETSFDVMNGTDGEDGVSPSVTVTEITGGHKVTVSDATGNKSFDVLDGDDGTSPTITVDTITDGHRITITDATGSKSFDVMNGVDGTGAGDMLSDRYDPQGKQTDIYQYTDDAVATKQDIITGTEGQFVVIGADGKPVAQTITNAEDLSV